MKKQNLILAALVFVQSLMFAQSFDIPMEGFSKKKPGYLFMTDGTKFTGTLKNFKREKGLIEEIKMYDEKDNKLKIDPMNIKYMYLAPSTLAKIGAVSEKIGSVRNWDKKVNLDTTLVNDGYVYFETSKAYVKKKNQELMLQLLNASFSSQIKVYHDPYAKETASVGVGGITVAGGLDKSYYIKKASDNIATRLYKKDYETEFKSIFSDCPALVSKYKANVKWSDFEAHVFEYNEIMSAK